MRAWVLLFLGLCVACAKTTSGEQSEVLGVSVREASISLKSGAIGAENKKDATYVLADVENTTKEDRLVAIEGALLDGAGQPVGALVGGEVRVPAGGARAFAVIAEGVQPGAVAARLRVHHATVADYPESLAVAGIRMDAVGEFQVATAEIRNPTQRDAMASVIAAYYDDAGRVISRPFVVLAIAAGGMRPVRFEGPKGAARADIFVGDVTF